MRLFGLGRKCLIKVAAPGRTLSIVQPGQLRPFAVKSVWRRQRLVTWTEFVTLPEALAAMAEYLAEEDL